MQELDINDVRLSTIDMTANKGGQHVPAMVMAVKAVHLPTGLEATCSTARSTYRNRNVAIEMLKTGLNKLEENR